MVTEHVMQALLQKPGVSRSTVRPGHGNTGSGLLGAMQRCDVLCVLQLLAEPVRQVLLRKLKYSVAQRQLCVAVWAQTLLCLELPRDVTCM
jgi:hypothetical protein